METINIGSGNLSGDGETLRSAFTKINENFAEVTETIELINQEPNLPETETPGFLYINEQGELSWENIEPGQGGSSTEVSHLALTGTPFAYEDFLEESVSFTKEDYGDQIDYIDEGIAITRGTRRPIYNPLVEDQFDRLPIGDGDGFSSPKGTRWNSDGWDDLTNLDQRDYTTFYDAVGGDLGNNVMNNVYIMHDIDSDLYFKFEFTVWGNGGQGAPLSYTRTQVNPETGEDIGEPVNFVKEGHSDTVDEISDTVTLVRASNQGIYNALLEDEWDDFESDGDPWGMSPKGTLWNSQGWSNLREVKDRVYVPFYLVIGISNLRNIPGRELVMWDMVNDKFYAVKFTSWTDDADGGGFSYTRRLINTSQYFTRQDYGDEVDTINDNVALTRGNGSGGIYNILAEDSWSNSTSPAGTLWNRDGWDDLSNIETRNYVNFRAALDNEIGNKVLNSELIMYLPDTDEYYAVKFSQWTQGGNGGGFSYEKYLLNTNSLKDGITFPDNSKITSGKRNPVISQAFGDWKITEYNGSTIVTSTPRRDVFYNTVASNSGTDSSNLNTAWDVNFIELYNNPESVDADIDSFHVSFDDGDTWIPIRLSGYSTGNHIFFWMDDDTATWEVGQLLKFRYHTGGMPIEWYNAPVPDFRGAIIEYHALDTNGGTIIGQMMMVSDSGYGTFYHNEVISGSGNLEDVELWYRYLWEERKLYFRDDDGRERTLRIHWTSRVFSTREYYD